MKLSIIIVNYRAWQHIATALEQLERDFPEDWEIIVVDNESEPTAFRDFQARFSWIHMIANPLNSGFGQGCVLGVAASSGENLLFMNPDVVATVDNIRNLIEEKEANPHVALLSPRQVGTDGKSQKVFDEFPGVLNQSKILKFLLRLTGVRGEPNPRKEYDELVYCDWVTGSFLLVSRDDYDRIGGWSPDYWMYAEDADLCRRAANLGLRTAYTPRVTVVHAHGGSSRINVAVKAMTKLEVIISKHAYVQKHLSGARRAFAHTLIGATRTPGLVVASLANLITLGRISSLRVRSRMLAGLSGYYLDVLRTGSWLSPRARVNQP